MQFREAILSKLAQFVCGGKPLPFPYRSSQKLNAFFADLNLDYVHRGETRSSWTRDTLIEIGEQSREVGIYPTGEQAIYAIIREIMNPKHFENDDNADYMSALATMNQTLTPYKLEVAFNEHHSSVELLSTEGKFISTAHHSPEKTTKIVFSPKVFEVPESIAPQNKLVAIMMPFGGFDLVHQAISKSCTQAGLEPRRADDIWNHSTILQDIFELIYASEIVISDFTNKNPNVMYETGIAHTLGKLVIPITQTLEHVPSNLHGHRVLVYVGANGEGLRKLESDLLERLHSIVNGPSLGKRKNKT